MHANNILYRLARWETPQGESVTGKLPASVQGHFGNELRSYIIYQHTQCRVTEPLLLEQLRELGLDISSGQLHSILTQGHDSFHQEKSEVLEGALIGSLIVHGLNPQLAIMSDDAGQFNVLMHALCWIHAERHINQLEPYHPEQAEAQKQVRAQIWNYYQQ